MEKMRKDIHSCWRAASWSFISWSSCTYWTMLLKWSFGFASSSYSPMFREAGLSVVRSTWKHDETIGQALEEYSPQYGEKEAITWCRVTSIWDEALRLCEEDEMPQERWGIDLTSGHAKKGQPISWKREGSWAIYAFFRRLAQGDATGPESTRGLPKAGTKSCDPIIFTHLARRIY